MRFEVITAVIMKMAVACGVSRGLVSVYWRCRKKFLLPYSGNIYTEGGGSFLL
jgi:hypothetical protein